MVSNRNEDLLRRDADVAVRIIARTQAGLVRKRAGAIGIGFFATRGYLEETRPAPKTFAELTKMHALIGPDRARASLEALTAAGLPITSRDLVLRTDNDLAPLAAIRAGVGIGICQVPLARELVRVLPMLRFELEAWVVTHEYQGRAAGTPGRRAPDHGARSVRATRDRTNRPESTQTQASSTEVSRSGLFEGRAQVGAVRALSTVMG